LTEGSISTTELTQRTGGENGLICCSKVLVNNETTVVNKTIVVNGLENISINITMTTSDQDSTLELKLVLLALLFLFLVATAVTIHLGTFLLNNVRFVVHAMAVLILMFRLRFLVDVHLLFFLLFVRNVQTLEHNAIQVAIMIPNDGLLLRLKAG
jgi:hypothetical protein